MNYSASTIFFYESTFTVQYSARVAGLIGLADYASVLSYRPIPLLIMTFVTHTIPLDTHGDYTRDLKNDDLHENEMASGSHYRISPLL